MYTDNKNLNYLDINKAAVLGTVFTGNGYAHINIIFFDTRSMFIVCSAIS